MKIAIDFDSVIARVIPPTLALLHRRYGVYVTEDDIQDYPKSFERLGIKGQFFRCLAEVHESNTLEFVDQWTQPALTNLMKKHEVYVLTGNPIRRLPPIELFLKTHNLDLSVVSSSPGVKDPDFVGGHPKDYYEWDILIEDDPRAVDLHKDSRRVIILDQPWNRMAPAGYRARDWRSVEAIIARLK